jgi:hypothetical protein
MTTRHITTDHAEIRRWIQTHHGAGIVTLTVVGSGWQDRLGEHRSAVVQASPLPGRHHPALRVVVLRFSLSFRDVEEMMLERGVVVSYETIRRWCAKFGQD